MEFLPCTESVRVSNAAGRNIHALDPYRMPSAAALERGSEAARLIVESHRKQSGGAYPETVAVNLWGLDAIKTKGESVAIVLHLVGARPVREGALGGLAEGSDICPDVGGTRGAQQMVADEGPVCKLCRS